MTACRERPPSTTMPPDAIAVVGTQAISAEAFLAQLARASARSDPADQVKQRVLEEMVQFEALYQKALAAGYDRDPEVAADLKRMIVVRFQESELLRLGIPEVSPAEVAEYYARNQPRYTVPGAARVAIIELKVPRAAEPEKRAEAADWAGTVRLEALADHPPDGTFGMIAQRYSEHQASRYHGGDVGWVTLGTNAAGWPSEILEALDRLSEPGEISPVIECTSSFYLLKLLEKRPARIRLLEEVRDGIHYLVRRQKEAEQQEQLRAAVKQGLDIAVNEPLLESISLPAKEPRPPGLPGGQSSTVGTNHEEKTWKDREPLVFGR